MIVVWAGTDWSPKSREVTRAAEHLSKSSAEPVLWCVQDEREEMTEEEKKLPKPPGAVWNIPAIQVVSPDGHTVFLSEGVSRDTLPAVVKQAVEAVKQQNKADALWEKPLPPPEQTLPPCMGKASSSFRPMRHGKERTFWKKSGRRTRKTPGACTSNTPSTTCPTLKKSRGW